MYYIINKITAEVNDISYTPIGYVETIEDGNYISNYSSMDTWINSNINDIKNEIVTIEDWIAINGPIYSGDHTTEVVPYGLQLITDLDNPEGGI